jgi:hypothetical protein
MLFELTRRRPVWKRLALTCELIQAGRMLMLAELRRRFPQASEEEATPSYDRKAAHTR